MLDRIRHLEIIREAATKHEDRHEQRDVQGEDEALVAQPLLEPAFGRCTVPHLLHVTHIGEVGIQVVLLRVCKCHIHVHMHVHVHVHIRMCVAQLQQYLQQSRCIDLQMLYLVLAVKLPAKMKLHS